MSDEWRSALGLRIRRQRRALCLTQQQIASQLGVNQTAVSQWEKGRTGVALRLRKRLAQALAMDFFVLFPPEEDEAAA